MAFIYDHEHLTPVQIKYAYTNEINEYKRKERALKDIINMFNDNYLCMDNEKLDELKKRLKQIQLHIYNLETELNILTFYD